MKHFKALMRKLLPGKYGMSPDNSLRTSSKSSGGGEGG